MTAAVKKPWSPMSDGRPLPPGVGHLLAPNASAWTYEGTNSWVIARGRSSVLIDPGSEAPSHLHALRRMDRADGRTVTAILLTHDHPDHSDGARALADSLDVPILGMSTRFADEILADGQVLRIDDLEVAIIHTPGHSDDSMCLWLPGSGTLFTGDTVLGARSAGVMGKLGDLLASLERLRDLVKEADVLALPGHGPAFTDFAESASRVIDVRTRRVNQVRRLIGGGDTTLLEITSHLYPELRGSRAAFAASTVLATVEYLLELDGDLGIPDDAQRARIMVDVEEHGRTMVARAHEHSPRARAVSE